MKTVFEEDYLICHFDEESKVLHHIWKDKAKGDNFRKGLLKVYDTYIALKKDHPGLHWLADTRKLSVLPLADQQWLDDTWNELLFVQAGVKTHAVIIGDDAFAKYAMEKFKNTMNKRYASQQIKLETFVDEREAYDWFKKLNREG
ncbi:hypothetical protein C900_04885 [Fulvivirga imtechensis AK7]|uniref:STAS/SEC14 domain-containing protein n=1 Tax=Fulvivirga imtechensis AK7 TaxID=1237149 RepID=L8JLG7_9BACT|nr:hypothetical protein [Fulvivirga imtechensis]ELR69660.1 hypothetical protein C900_04885 [Fulvivirga imtechensis AK7]